VAVPPASTELYWAPFKVRNHQLRMFRSQLCAGSTNWSMGAGLVGLQAHRRVPAAGLACRRICAVEVEDGLGPLDLYLAVEIRGPVTDSA
jgi:hypothetical protein